MHSLLFALWFFTPAGIATLAPVLAAITPGLRTWDAPMDFGRTFRGRRLLGTHKTWRGFISAVVLGTAWFVCQMWLYDHNGFIRSISPFDYAAVWVGVGLSAGAIIGDAVKSFFKRQLHIPSGQSWFPYDQLDFILGGLLLSLPFVRLPLLDYGLIVVCWLGIHVLFNGLGYLLGLQEHPL